MRRRVEEGRVAISWMVNHGLVPAMVPYRSTSTSSVVVEDLGEAHKQHFETDLGVAKVVGPE